MMRFVGVQSSWWTARISDHGLRHSASPSTVIRDRRVGRRAAPFDVQWPARHLRDREADRARHLLERQLVLEHQAAALDREPEVPRRRERRGFLGGVEAHAGRRERLPACGQHAVLVAHRRGHPGRGVPPEPGHHQRGPARQVPINRHLPDPGLVRRGKVVAPARADEREHEVRARAAMGPHPGGAMVLEPDPPVVERVRLGRRRHATSVGSAGERRGRPRQLAQQVEGELQPARGTAVLVLIAMAVRVDDSVAVEGALERPGRVTRAPEPHGTVAVRVAPGQRQGRQLDGQRGTERPGRTTPGDRGPVARPDREDEVERGPQPFLPHRSETGRERLAEEPDVRGVDVVATDAVVGVVEVPARVLAEHRRRACDRGSPAARCRRPGRDARGRARSARAPRRSCGGGGRSRAARSIPSCRWRWRPDPAARRRTRRAGDCRRTDPGAPTSRRSGRRRRCAWTGRRPRSAAAR